MDLLLASISSSLLHSQSNQVAFKSQPADRYTAWRRLWYHFSEVVQEKLLPLAGGLGTLKITKNCLVADPGLGMGLGVGEILASVAASLCLNTTLIMNYNFITSPSVFGTQVPPCAMQ